MTKSPANDNRSDKAPACPICGRPRRAEHRPFCSRRCADVDLHRWLAATYVIAGGEAAEDETAAPLRRPRDRTQKIDAADEKSPQITRPISC